MATRAVRPPRLLLRAMVYGIVSEAIAFGAWLAASRAPRFQPAWVEALVAGGTMILQIPSLFLTVLLTIGSSTLPDALVLCIQFLGQSLLFTIFWYVWLQHRSNRVRSRPVP
ncbi:MAG: hypothetical protein ABI584_11085 [Acidobacteriota bacterium]